MRLIHQAESIITVWNLDILLIPSKCSYSSNVGSQTIVGGLANHSLKLTENTACFFAARKTLFREMAVRAARIVSGDLAARRRSLAPVR